jgi:hypothetical protein
MIIYQRYLKAVHNTSVWGRWFNCECIKELSKYKLDEWKWTSDGREVAPNQQVNIVFYGKENGNRELGTGFLYIRVLYQQLRGLRLLVIRCTQY